MSNLKWTDACLILLICTTPTYLFGQTIYPYPDPTFGINGTAEITIPSATDIYLGSCVTLDDESVIITGHGTKSKRLSTALKLDATGSTEYSFGNSGYLYNDHPNPHLENAAGQILKRSDGKLLVSFMALNPKLVFSMVCFDSYGKLDNTYGNNGFAQVLQEPLSNSYGYDVHSHTLTPDNRVVLCGRMSNVLTYDEDHLLLARYSSNGFIDSTFGVNGIDSVRVADGSFGLRYVVVLNDLSILSGGSRKNPVANRNEEILAKWTPNGELDSTFGQNGIVVIEPLEDSSSILLSAIKTLPDKHIIACGFTKRWGAATKGEPFIARFDQNGKIDTTFGNQGFSQYPNYPSSAIISHSIGAIYPLSNGGFLALNTMSKGGFQHYSAISIYNAQGEIDSDWNSGDLYYLTKNSDTLAIRGLSFSKEQKLVLVTHRGGLADKAYATRLVIGHSPVGISNQPRTRQVSPVIYPNPVGNNLHLNLNDLVTPDKPFEYQIISTDGQIVISNRTISTTHLSIDVSFLPKGVYILSILTDNSNEPFKFVKL